MEYRNQLESSKPWSVYELESSNWDQNLVTDFNQICYEAQTRGQKWAIEISETSPYYFTNFATEGFAPPSKKLQHNKEMTQLSDLAALFFLQIFL